MVTIKTTRSLLGGCHYQWVDLFWTTVAVAFIVISGVILFVALPDRFSFAGLIDALVHQEDSR